VALCRTRTLLAAPSLPSLASACTKGNKFEPWPRQSQACLCNSFSYLSPHGSKVYCWYTRNANDDRTLSYIFYCCLRMGQGTTREEVKLLWRA
jgi:hypothetical protein